MSRYYMCTLYLMQTYHIIVYFVLPQAPIAEKTVFWKLIENVGAPMLYILRLTSVRLYSSRGACSLTGACVHQKAQKYSKPFKNENFTWEKKRHPPSWESIRYVLKMYYSHQTLTVIKLWYQTGNISRRTQYLPRVLNWESHEPLYQTDNFNQFTSVFIAHW